MSRLSGRRVVVTGAAGGIGAAIVRTFAAEGARLTLLDERGEEAALLAKEVGGRSFDVDLTDVGAIREAMDRAVRPMGGLDVLVNGAALTRPAPLLELEPEEWDAVFAVNARAVLVTTQLAARAMIAFRTPSDECAGKIVNLVGMGGCRPGDGQAHQAAATAAVIALTRAAAAELGPHGITVNCLCPGLVRTELGPAVRTDADRASWSARSPLGRLAEVHDVARAALFLASADSDYLTGDALNVNGGMLAS
jgi:3-oxoacyl-[acyl-carrier protein] reductase